MRPLIITGPSGAGKSTFGEFLQSQGWLYLEADVDGEDGITQLGLRRPWDTFWHAHKGSALGNELCARMKEGGNEGVVLSLPSRALPAAAVIDRVKSDLTVRILYGDPRYCLRAFVEREKRTGRGLAPSHWDLNNLDVFKAISGSSYHPYLVDTFSGDGDRIPWSEVVSKLG